MTGNLVYRRFCRIDAGKVPDAKTILRHGQLLDGPELRELRSTARCVIRSNGLAISASTTPRSPKPGYRSKERVAHERQRWFRRARAWRAGGEARISRLKASLRHGAHSLQRTSRHREVCVLGSLRAIANNLVAIATRAG